MLFQESQHVGQDQFFKTIQNVGGTLNGGTNKDGTVYYEIVPNNALETVLWLESDRMGWLLPTVTEAAFMNQQEVVQNEKRQRVDNRPYGHANYVMIKNMYPEDHPYNWTTIGELEDLQNATLKDVRNFYSVSISGYHIAEAGANPITQVAFTLANGFTLIEYYLARGLRIDNFAHNLSFFFSNGMDPEYAVIGRVARRIFSVAIRYLYNGNERSQKLKYHIQTSGRSLHAMEIDFNDIRTTLQALYAIYDLSLIHI